MLRRRLTHTRLLSLPRLLLAAGLSLALLSGVLSLGVTAALHQCSMPCCTSGETDGENSSCDLDLHHQTNTTFQSSEKTRDDDPLCGATQTIVANAPRAKSAVSPKSFNKTADHTVHSEDGMSRHHRVSNALTQKCPEPCTAATTASSQSRRSKELALFLSKGSQQDSQLLWSHSSSVTPFKTNSYERHLSPRGPPTLLV